MEKNENQSLCLNCGYVLSPRTAELRKRENTTREAENSSVQPPSNRLTLKQDTNDIIDKIAKIKVADSWEKNFVLALTEISRISFKLALPNTTLEKTALLYKAAVEKGLSKGRSRKILCSSIVYLCCEQDQIAITTKDIAKASSADPEQITHCYRRIARLLGSSIRPTKTHCHIDEISGRLKLSFSTVELAKRVNIALERKGDLIGKDPRGVAGGLIYLASVIEGVPITQRKISEVCNVTEVIIRRRYAEAKKKVLLNIQI
jgi:transcription initiation factor TFIIB